MQTAPLRVIARQIFAHSYQTSKLAPMDTPIGYTHTHSDATGIDLPTLVRFPMDEKVEEASRDAMDECEIFSSFCMTSQKRQQPLIYRKRQTVVV